MIKTGTGEDSENKTIRYKKDPDYRPMVGGKEWVGEVWQVGRKSAWEY